MTDYSSAASTVKTALDAAYQEKLESGTNIKTINNESIMGSGNISISGGGSVDIVTSWNSTPSDSKVPSEKLAKNSLDGKLDKSIRITASSTSPNDLNSITTNGFYYSASNNDCAYISNLAETGVAFFLIVENWGTYNYTKQTITHYTSGKTYTRINNNGTWTSWKQLLNDDNLGTSYPKPLDYKVTGIVGTSKNYSREDHRHSRKFAQANGGVSTATYVNIMQISCTASWQDRPITFALQRRAKDRLTYVNVKLTNNNINTTNTTIDKFHCFGDTSTTLYLQQVEANKWNLIAQKPANDEFHIIDLYSGNTGVDFTQLNTSFGSNAPTSTTENPVYTCTNEDYILSSTKVISWSSTVSDDNVPSEKLVKDYIDDQIGTAIQYIQQ